MGHEGEGKTKAVTKTELRMTLGFPRTPSLLVLPFELWDPVSGLHGLALQDGSFCDVIWL